MAEENDTIVQVAKITGKKLMPRSRQNILLNFQLMNEASRANLNKNKRIFK